MRIHEYLGGAKPRHFERAAATAKASTAVVLAEAAARGYTPAGPTEIRAMSLLSAADRQRYLDERCGVPTDGAEFAASIKGEVPAGAGKAFAETITS